MQWAVSPVVRENETYQTSFGELVRFNADLAQVEPSITLLLPMGTSEDVGKQVAFTYTGNEGSKFALVVTGGPKIIHNQSTQQYLDKGARYSLTWIDEGWAISP
jgi:hypothetical protein